MKKIVFYFGFSIEHWVPFSTFPHKAGTYYALIDALLAQGCECFIAGGRKAYQGSGFFTATRRYQKTTHSWEFCGEPVEASAILDRTRWVDGFDTVFEQRAVNPLPLKMFGNNKFQMLDVFHSYTKRFFLAQSRETLLDIIKNFSSTERMVAKPVNGIKGRGIFIGTPKEILAAFPSLSEPYLIQEFIDTSHGIPGVTTTNHDIRFVVAHGEIILAALRTPKEGSLLANVAQGGSIQEIPLPSLPLPVQECAQEIKKRMDELFGPSYYSLDFGIEEGIPYLFEINDRIGFPRETMPHATSFAKGLAQTLLSKSS